MALVAAGGCGHRDTASARVIVVYNAGSLARPLRAALDSFAVQHAVQVQQENAGSLETARGIEIGHVFQLGRKYADAASLDALGPDSRPVRITMGSYGIGVSRLVAVIAEQSHDESGLIWPRAVAPADVHVVIAGKSEEIVAGGEKLAADLEVAGLRVLLDDRKSSPGVKFADAELIGVPTIVVVGRGLANGVIEVKDRRSGDRTEIPLNGAVAHLADLVRMQ